MMKRILAVFAGLALAVGIGMSPAYATGTQYYYAEATQTATTQGAGASADVKNPGQVASGEHSLWEIALTNTVTGDRVEVGWNRDPNLYGDGNTHFFTFAAIGGVGQGYNAANPAWHDEPSNLTVNAGSSIMADLNTLKSFQVLYDVPSAAWWFAYNGVYVGHIDASAWPSSRFTSSTYTQVFGEVWGPNPSCVDMGSGINAGLTGAARFGSVTYYGTGIPAVSLTAHADSPYTIASISGSVRSFSYGGGGSC